MAQASIQHRPTSRPRRKPSPATVLQLYRHEVAASGLRGAPNRVAAALGISDDTVRRIVARDEEARAARETTPAELQFVPPDPDYEAERDAANAAEAEAIAARLAVDLAAKTPQPADPPSDVVMSSAELELRDFAEETSQADAAVCRTAERETLTEVDAATPQPVTPAVPVVIRERVVVRMPAETPRRDVYSRLASIHADTIAGPPLALAVALLLIALAFWGLG